MSIILATESVESAHPLNSENLTWCFASSWFTSSPCLLPDSQQTTCESHQAWWDLGLSGLWLVQLPSWQTSSPLWIWTELSILPSEGSWAAPRAHPRGEMYCIIILFSCTETCIMPDLIQYFWKGWGYHHGISFVKPLLYSLSLHHCIGIVLGRAVFTGLPSLINERDSHCAHVIPGFRWIP